MKKSQLSSMIAHPLLLLSLLLCAVAFTSAVPAVSPKKEGLRKTGSAGGAAADAWERRHADDVPVPNMMMMMMRMKMMSPTSAIMSRGGSTEPSDDHNHNNMQQPYHRGMASKMRRYKKTSSSSRGSGRSRYWEQYPYSTEEWQNLPLVAYMPNYPSNTPTTWNCCDDYKTSPIVMDRPGCYALPQLSFG